MLRSLHLPANAALDGNTSALAEAIRLELQSSLMRSNEGTSPHDADSSSAGLRLRAVGLARRALLAMRSSSEIGDDAFHQLEEEIDRFE